MKTLTPDTSAPVLVLPIQVPEDTTNGIDGDDWSALSLENPIQRLLNRIEKNRLDTAATLAALNALIVVNSDDDAAILSAANAIANHLADTDAAHNASAIAVATIAGVMGLNVQTVLQNLRNQIGTLETAWRFQPLGTLPAGLEGTIGDTGSLRLYQNIGDHSNPFEVAEKTVGVAAGAGIDYVLPELGDFPANAKAIVLKAFLGMDAYSWVDLYLGNVSNLYETEPVLSCGATWNGNGGNSMDTNIESHAVAPWIVVTLTGTNTFKMRVRSSGSSSLETEGIWVNLTPIGVFL